MNLNKTLLFATVLSMMLSCSQDKTETQATTSQNVEDFRIPKIEYDESNLGVYKGIFTTLDGDLQGEILISLDKDRKGIAELSLSTGEKINLESSVLNNNSIVIDQLNFTSVQSSKTVSLNFTVEDNGNEPLVSNVIYDNKQSSIQLAKETLNRPVNPVYGTYICTNCAEVYPQFSSRPKTFSLMYSGPIDNLTITTSVIYSGSEYVSTNNTMNGCTASGTNRVCAIAGSTIVRGGKTMNYSGSYQYRQNEINCTYTTGTWSVDIIAAVLEGTFISNRTTPCN